MEVKEDKLIFTQQEVVHILWNHKSTSVASQDSDSEDFIIEVAENYSQVRQSDTKDRDVVIDNMPLSRELLARRILRQERQEILGTETPNFSTIEQVAAMKKLHRLGRTATARMARRVMLELKRQHQQESTD